MSTIQVSTAQEVYMTTVRQLPPDEQLRLAALILAKLTQTPTAPQPVDVSDSWSDEDLHDLRAHSLHYAATIYPEEEELV